MKTTNEDAIESPEFWVQMTNSPWGHFVSQAENGWRSLALLVCACMYVHAVHAHAIVCVQVGVEEWHVNATLHGGSHFCHSSLTKWSYKEPHTSFLGFPTFKYTPHLCFHPRFLHLFLFFFFSSPLSLSSLGSSCTPSSHSRHPWQWFSNQQLSELTCILNFN